MGIKDRRKYFWLDWVQFCLVVLLAPLFLFPSMKTIWIIGIVPIVWAFRWMKRKEPFERTILDLAIGVLAVAVFVTCLIVPDISFSLPKIAGVLFGLFWFYSAVALLKREMLMKWGIVALLGAGLVLGVGGSFDMIKGAEFPSIGKVLKIVPEIKLKLPGAEQGINPNPLAGTLILVIPLSLILIFSCFSKNKEDRFTRNKLLSIFVFIFLAVSLAVLCSVLFLTQSVGSWFAVMISGLVLIFPGKWKRWGLVLAFLLMGFVILSRPERILVKGNAVKDYIAEKKIGVREPFWMAGIKTIKEYPLSGIGMNRIRLLPSVGYESSHVHNQLIHTAAELGIPALVAYLAILIGAGWMCYKVWLQSGVGWMRAAALGLGAGQMAHFVFGMGDSIPLGAKPGVFFWFSLALITAMFNYIKRKEFSVQDPE